jgi:hypothetical protein
MKMQILIPRIPSSRTVLVLLFLAATAFGLLGMNARPAHALSLYSVNQTKSGLAVSDPLNAQLSQAQLAASTLWTFGGSAAVFNAPFAFNEDANGLHIGVQATSAAPYAGYYAELLNNAVLSHAVLTAPSRTVPSGYPNVALYVQTGGPNVDYVECGAVTSSALTYWQVGMATGDPTHASTFQPLYIDMSLNQPLTRDCTIVTNGQNLLTVYLDGTQVFTNSNLNLGYQAPFQFFIETQTSYTGGMFYGTFQDFYLANGDSVTVTNMPANSVAQIVASPSGQVLASAPADGSGTAKLPIGNIHMPVVANIQVTLLGLVVGSTSSPVSIWGGDSYALSLPLGLAGGLVGAGPSPSGASASVAVPTPTTIAPAVGGAVQSAAAPSIGAVASAAPSSKAAAGPVTAVTATPLTALSLLAALGGGPRRGSTLGQEEPC